MLASLLGVLRDEENLAQLRKLFKVLREVMLMIGATKEEARRDQIPGYLEDDLRRVVYDLITSRAQKVLQQPRPNATQVATTAQLQSPNIMVERTTRIERNGIKEYKKKHQDMMKNMVETLSDERLLQFVKVFYGPE
jgi:hypothetical protein